MTVFSAAINTLFDDPNIGIDATYYAGGEGAGVAVRIVWRAPDQVADFGGGRFVARGRMLEVRVSDVAMLSAGDTVTVAGQEYVISGEPLIDDNGLLWRAEARPA